MLKTICDNKAKLSVAPLCNALDVPRATLYRFLSPKPPMKPRPKPKQALTSEERQVVLNLLHSERFVDMPPAAVYSTLLDEQQYYCSSRTMYRILADHGEVRERRNLRNHRDAKKPELLATKPCELWSWDISKLCGPRKWTYFYLYVILDVFSRYVVGWMVAHREAAALANRLIYDTCQKQKINRNQLTLHADRGPSMRSKCVAMLLTDLGVTKTHSRPYVSNDNPYSESHFKTLKYRPEFPKRFGCIQDARSFCDDFFTWYNENHYHSGIGFLTPESVHYGFSDQIIEDRQATLKMAFQRYPERFTKQPKVKKVPAAVWINRPKELDEDLLIKAKEAEELIFDGIGEDFSDKMLSNKSMALSHPS